MVIFEEWWWWCLQAVMGGGASKTAEKVTENSEVADGPGFFLLGSMVWDVGIIMKPTWFACFDLM